MGLFYSRVFIPPAVVDELDKGRALGADLPEISALPWVKVQAPDGLVCLAVAVDLGAGEREVLALGLQVPDAVVILDERLGRACAATLKLTFTGTLGILLCAKADGQIRLSARSGSQSLDRLEKVLRERRPLRCYDA